MGEPDPARIAPLLAGQRLLGVVRSYNKSSGFGFIVCKETNELLGRDVFIHRNEAEPLGASVGATVSFTIELQPGGKPKARNVKMEAPGIVEEEKKTKEEQMKDMVDGMAEQALDKYYIGLLSSYNQKQGFGFIQCEETFKIFGRDVFIHHSNLNGFNAGDNIGFKVHIDVDKGTPQGKDLTSPFEVIHEAEPEIGLTGIPMIGMIGMMSMMGMDVKTMAGMFGMFGNDSGGLASPDDMALNAAGMSNQEWKQSLDQEEEMKDDTSTKMDRLRELITKTKRFVGIIRCFNRTRGFGFIGCDEANQASGSDVFLHNEQRDNHEVGDVVSFAIEIRGNQARARDLKAAKNLRDRGESSPPRATWADERHRSRSPRR